MTYQRADVDGRAGLFHRPRVGVYAGIDKLRLLAEQVHRIGHGVADGGAGGADAAVADNHRGHALADFRQVFRDADNVDIVVGVDINKPRRQHPPFAVDDLPGLDLQRRRNRHNPFAAYRHVRAVLRAAAAVDNGHISE